MTVMIRQPKSDRRKAQHCCSRASSMISAIAAMIRAQVSYISVPSVLVSIGRRIKPFSTPTTCAMPTSSTSLVNFL